MIEPRPQTKPHPDFLALAETSGARLTGKPDGSEAITLVFSVDAWQKFDSLVHSIYSKKEQS